MDESKYCAKCGAKCNIHAKFCAACGTKHAFKLANSKEYARLGGALGVGTFLAVGVMERIPGTIFACAVVLACILYDAHKDARKVP